MPRQALTYIRKTNRGGNKQRERVIQHALTRTLTLQFPEVVDFFNDWASGAYLTEGQRKERRRLASGKGWSDLFIPYPMTHTLPDGTTKTYYGLFIEIKKEGTRIYVKTGPRKGQLVADEQIRIEAAFLERMNSLGYMAVFGVGMDKCEEILQRYFKRPQNLQIL